MTREELIEELKNRIGFETDNESYAMSKSEREFYMDVLQTLEQEPKTGHCKDCKYYHTAWDGTETHYYEDYWCDWVEPNENDFCSLYEPKEEVSK